MTKRCSKCREQKQIDEFCKEKKSKDGHRHWCKPCMNAYLKIYRAAHKEEAKRYRKDNADKMKAYNEAYKPRKNAWITQRRQNDINFAMAFNLRTRFHSFVSTKGKHTFDVLGVPCDTFLSWIEFQFEEGMSWNNYGTEWHLDHILPVSKFDMTNETDKKVCFSWANFQPLYSQDNLSKSNSIYLHDFFNCFISAHRFIANEQLGSLEYQTLTERLRWLRATISDTVKSS